MKLRLVYTATCLHKPSCGVVAQGSSDEKPSRGRYESRGHEVECLGQAHTRTAKHPVYILARPA